MQDEVLGKAKDERYRKDGMSDVAFVNDRGQTLTSNRCRRGMPAHSERDTIRKCPFT